MTIVDEKTWAKGFWQIPHLSFFSRLFPDLGVAVGSAFACPCFPVFEVDTSATLQGWHTSDAPASVDAPTSVDTSDMALAGSVPEEGS